MRYGIAVLAIIFLTIAGTVVLFGRGNNKQPVITAKVVKLADYENKDTAHVSWTMQGRLVGDDQRKSIRVTVSRNQRRVEILSGYDERTERSKDFGNTPAAFAAFLRALDGANFARERTAKQPDERAACPTGSRFIYRLADGGKEVVRSWSDTCLTADGTFGGGSNAAQIIQQLFKNQVTDYSKFVAGVQL